MVAVTRALRAVPPTAAGGPDDGGTGAAPETGTPGASGPSEPSVEPPPELVEAVRSALDATDATALAAEVAQVDEATATRVRAHLSSFGSTAPADQGAEMARLGLV
jgi:hypothetical protein